jgi:hypothetical protein
VSRRRVVTAAAGCMLLLGAQLPQASALAATPNRPTALLWGHRYFVDRAAFVRWLEIRQGGFSRWARLHPLALATLLGATEVPKPLTKTDLKGTGQRGSSQPPPVAAATPPSAVVGSGAGLRHLEAVLLACAVLLLALAVAPVQLLDRFARAPRLAQQRWPLGAAGASILAALVLARSFG